MKYKIKLSLSRTHGRTQMGERTNGKVQKIVLTDRTEMGASERVMMKPMWNVSFGTQSFRF